MRVTVSAIVLVAASLLVPVLSSAHTTNLNFEAGEANRNDLELRGQHNCVAAAAGGIAGATEACPVATTSHTYPAAGIRVLDGRVAPKGPVKAFDYVDTDPEQDPAGAVTGAYGNYVDGLYQDAQRGENLRQFDENIPDVIPPGRVNFHAWYGYWNDDNGDGIVQEVRPNTGGAPKYQPGNEWVALSLSVSELGQVGMGVWIEPGSHPDLSSKSRPTEAEPDLRLHPRYPRAYWDATSDVVFTDGSLLQPVTTTTVFRPILTPSADGKTPYSLSSTSLVDIDVYSAVTAGPVSDLYVLTAAPFVNFIGSPGQSLCPNRCRVEISPLPLGGSPFESTSGEIHKAFFASYEHEIEPGSGSSASGRHADYIEKPRARFDIIPMWAVPVPNDGQSPLRGALVGTSANGGAAVAPGSLTLDGWSGLWHDVNEDGWVGYAASDPYEGGHRPNPDTHVDAKGEWTHTPLYSGPVGSSLPRFNVTLVPKTNWGAGVYVFWKGFDQRPVGGPECHYEQNCVKPPEDYHTTGSTPIEITLQYSSGSPGYWTAMNDVIFPSGSESIEFTICSPTLYVKTGEADLEPVSDCDEIGAWDRPAF